MFYSLMAILHERLPIATTFFRLKKQYRDMRKDRGECSSPVRTIASPKMIRGLSITKTGKMSQENDMTSSPGSPEIRIKNMKQSDLKRGNSRMSRHMDSGMRKGESEMGESFSDIKNMSLNQGNFLQRG